MKFQKALISVLLLFISVTLADAEGRRSTSGTSQKIERSLAVDPAVVVSLCVDSGDVTVRGWNKNEVLAKSSEVGRLELKRADVTNTTGSPSKVVVWLADKEGPEAKSGCQAFGDVQLMVPRGASVYLQTGDGEVDVGDVATVFARTETGEVSIQKASRSVEAITFSGTISVENSNGRMSMKTVGGSIRAANLSPNDENDCFEATTISGDVQLDEVAHQQVTVKTTNGKVDVSGPLADRGRYSFNTTTSDVTMSMPANSSFRLTARIARDRELITDFPLTFTMEDQVPMPAKKAMPVEPPPPGPTAQPKEPVVVMVDPQEKVIKVKPVVVKTFYSLRRINAVHGSGNALINIASFSGTIHLIDSGN